MFFVWGNVMFETVKDCKDKKEMVVKVKMNEKTRNTLSRLSQRVVSVNESEHEDESSMKTS